MKRPILLILILIMIHSSACTHRKTRVDMMVHNATIYCVDSGFSITEAFVIRDGIIVETGREKYLRKKYHASEMLDLKGRHVYPGFIDAHCHFTGYGESLMHADLVGSKSFGEIVGILRQHHRDFPSEWILGRGWDQNDWEVKEYPDKSLLDSAFPDNPVLITRIDGHGAIANQVALDLAGITPGTRVEGGSILLKNGIPTGVLIDNAIGLVRGMIPGAGSEQTRNALIRAQENCFSVGLTSVHDAGLDKSAVLLIDSLQEIGELKMRIYAMLNPTDENYEHFIRRGIYKTPFLHVRSVKLYADGALGSRGALLMQDYSDEPANKGLQVTPTGVLRQHCSRAFEHGYQVNTHCIGDGATHLMLSIYGGFLEKINDLRWRIEHAQVVHPDDFARFGEYSVIPSVQPIHATSDMYWAVERLGPERIKGAYAYRVLLANSGYLACGSDFPVESINPLLGFYAAVSRKDLNGYPDGGFQPGNSLAREEALKGMTIWAAMSAFEELEKGSIEAGKFADFVVTDKDLLKAAEDEIPDIRVLMTFVGGELVCRKDSP